MLILGDKRNIVIKYKKKTVVGLVEPIHVTGPTGKSKEW
jgi:hypothetical protein